MSSKLGLDLTGCVLKWMPPCTGSGHMENMHIQKTMHPMDVDFRATVYTHVEFM